MTRFLACLAIVLAAGCSTPRVTAINYSKASATDIEAVQDKQAFQGVSGVDNVIMESERSGAVRMQVFVEEGKELGLFAKAEELGYTRVK